MIVSLYYKFSLIVGYLKKILFLGSYQAGKNFKLDMNGGILGNKDKIIIGNNVVLSGWLISDGGEIKIGDNTIIHKGTIIRSMNLVQIGKYCDIASDCAIQDHNSRSLDYRQRRRYQQYRTFLSAGRLNEDVLNSPVKIGDDVWIGRRVTILKGVKVGNRAVLATNAVITKDVPESSVAAGNPAQTVKKID